MQTPLLQLALDTETLSEAFAALSNGLGQAVDIIEAGTVLILSEGLKAVSIIRSAYPDKLVVADDKVVDQKFAAMIMKHRPDFTTVLSISGREAKAKILQAAAEYGVKLQLEQNGGNLSTWEEIADARRQGFEYIVFSRPFDRRKQPWGQADVEDIRKYCDAGWKVTVTGGMTYDDLDVIAGLPIYAIICGRSVRNAADPAAEARRIKDRIRELWA